MGGDGEGGLGTGAAWLFAISAIVVSLASTRACCAVQVRGAWGLPDTVAVNTWQRAMKPYLVEAQVGAEAATQLREDGPPALLDDVVSLSLFLQNSRETDPLQSVQIKNCLFCVYFTSRGLPFWSTDRR